MRAGPAARARTCRDCAGSGRRPGCARPLRRDPPQSKMSAAKSTPAAMKRRLVAVVLDEESIGRSNPDVEHERQVAIYDLLEQNSFAPVAHDDGPYSLHLCINGNSMVLVMLREDGTRVIANLFPLKPLH